MTTTMTPITDEEFLGYFCAMLTDEPWGEPATALDDIPLVSGSD